MLLLTNYINTLPKLLRQFYAVTKITLIYSQTRQITTMTKVKFNYITKFTSVVNINQKMLINGSLRINILSRLSFLKNIFEFFF